MFKNSLKQLYYNKIPFESELYFKGKKCNKFYKKIDEADDYFRKILSPEDYKKFEEFGETHIHLCHIHEYENFVYGFKLAINLIMSSLTPKNKRK
ncbi:MAG: DUF6809 family protein [Acidaminococcaceae bacterium]